MNPSYLDQSVTLSAAVFGSGATPTGSVTFKEGTTILGTVPLVNGQASFTTAFTKIGTDSIVADYSGDQNYKAANSSPVKQFVQPYATSTALVSNSNPSSYGDIQEREHDARYCDPERRSGESLEGEDSSRLRFADCDLQRQLDLCQEHVGGCGANGESGGDQHSAGVVAESIQIGPIGQIHGHAEQHRRFAQRPNRHFHSWNDNLGHGDDQQQRRGHVCDDGLAGGFRCGHVYVCRRCGLQWSLSICHPNCELIGTQSVFRY